MELYSPPKFVRQQPSWQIGQLGNYARNAVSDAMATEGVRRNHATVLALLDEAGPLSQAEISRRLWIDPSDLNAVLNDLEERDCVRREPDPDDGRRKIITIRPKGVKLFARLKASIESAQDELLKPLSSADRKKLMHLLDELLAHHDELRENES
jgi:DNA-binding MarR family transcriptional regulator